MTQVLCPNCGDRFTSDEGMQMHLQAKHSGDSATQEKQTTESPKSNLAVLAMVKSGTKIVILAAIAVFLLVLVASFIL